MKTSTGAIDFHHPNIRHAVWLYYRFNLGIRDVEDLLAERNISVSYEAIRLWVNKFGLKFACRLKRKHQGIGDTYFLDKVFVRIGVIQHDLWRAVDQDGEVADVYLQPRRDAKAASRFFQRLFEAGGVPGEIVTDKLRSYGVAHRTLIPETSHNTEHYANNRAELSHQPTRLCRARPGRSFELSAEGDLVRNGSDRIQSAGTSVFRSSRVLSRSDWFR